MNVAATLIKLKMDLQSICGGLLHDVVEDCDVSEDEIRKEFGDDIANIVIGCTKISKIKFKTKEESQAENFRKMVVAMAKDIRVIIVKLADRMHNMLTLQYVSKEKQVKKAQETLDIYVPLASRLGINSVKSELEDLCLRFLHPEVYYRLAEKIAMKKSERETYIRDTVENIKEKLSEYSIKADVSGRPKHFYSIYKKMHNRGVDYDQIQDLLAFRIIVGNITECYKCLGIIHSSFTPVPGRFKDYIAIPKVNNYQSLHTTVIGPAAERIEIQIRTSEMHEIAETGIAAHWVYKSGSKKPKNLKWVEELLEYNRDIKQSSEFMDVVKNDLDIGGIFVFTPNGDVRELRHGASPLDFAYSVHTDVGHRCVGAKVNGKMVPLKYRLKSGDTVEVLTSKSQTPSKDWLKIAKTSRARTKIKQFLLKVERDRNRVIGEESLEKALKDYATNAKTLEKKNEFNKVFDQLHVKDLNELYLHLGSGRFSIKQVLELIPSIDYESQDEKIKAKKNKEFDTLYKQISNTARKTSNKDNAVIVDGLDDIMVRMGKCCNPIPGDPIVGFITRGRGITIHTKTCPRTHEIEDSRKIHVEWNAAYSFRHPVSVRVITHDRPGTLSRITNNIHGHGINIKSAIAKSLPDMKGSFLFEIEVKDYSEYLKVVSLIEAMEEIISVTRA
jgi:GTP pyrophosphokinase